MDYQQKLTKAKKELVKHQAFFAQIVLGMVYIENNITCPTMATDGEAMYFNKNFVDSISQKDLEFVLCHEALHVACLHPFRRAERHPMKWNYAIDYVVNDLLLQAGFTLPDGCLHDEKYRGMDAEEVYNLLPEVKEITLCMAGQGNGEGEENQDGQGQGSSQGDGEQKFGAGMGQVIDPKGDAADLEDKEREAKQRIVQAANVAKARGTIPQCLEGMITEALKPKVPWQEVLADFIMTRSKNDYSWAVPNRRYLSSGLYLPSLDTPEIGDLYMIIDTSGSVSQHEMNEFNAEIQAICQGFDCSLTAVYVDTAYQREQELEPGDDLDPPEGGGTCFRPGFTHIEKQGYEPACVVYLTDGYCDSFPEMPDYPVMWCVSNKMAFNPPFGETVYINE